VYFTDNGTVQALVGAAPGIVAPTFRILGDAQIGGSGVVGIVAGGDDCTVSTVGTTTRTTCTGHLFAGENGTVTEVTDPMIALNAISPTQPQVAVADTGVAFFSLPGSGSAPVLVRDDKDQVTTILAANASVPGVGQLIRPQVAAASSDEKLLLTTTLASDPGPSRPTVLAILDGQTFTVLDREGTPAGDQVITNLRAVGLDENGQALYLARIGAAGDVTAPRTLRLSDGTTAVDVAAEHAALQGSDKTLLSITAQRINRRGDVAFVAELGQIDSTTTTLDEIRAVVRLADGTYVVPLSTATAGDLGTITSISIAGFDDSANLLMLVRRAPSQTLLVLAPSVAH
jgi:hypothetical protein